MSKIETIETNIKVKITCYHCSEVLDIKYSCMSDAEDIWIFEVLPCTECSKEE